MGKNRKWVLEDKIQEAVWQTVLRGRRPPSAQWPRDNRSSSKANGNKADLKPKPKAQFQFGQFAPKIGAPPPLPEEVMSAARARVVKLRTVLETLGEDDEMYDTLKASLRKAEMKAQEPPLSEQISATRAFIGRKLKRVDEARQASDKARTALTEAVAAQEAQERLFADGERRLEELLLKELTMPSPFSVPPVPIVPDVQAEVARMQEIIDRLQEELAMMRSGRVSETVEDADDEDMVAGLPHKKSRVGPSTPEGLSGGRQPTTPLAITGGHASASQ